MLIVMRLAIISVGLTLVSMFGAPAAYASGDAPWCAVSQIGEGALAWNCQYETAEECAPAALTGDRGSCTPNPYHPRAPAPASVPSKGTINAMPGTTANRKNQEHVR